MIFLLHQKAERKDVSKNTQRTHLTAHIPATQAKNVTETVTYPNCTPHIQIVKNKITSNSYCLDITFYSFNWLTLFFCHENQELPYQFGILHDSLQVDSLTVREHPISNTIHRTIPTGDQDHFRRSASPKSTINLKHTKLSLPGRKK